MKKEELDRLLEKYYKGDSSDEEERSLKKYFYENTISEGYEDDSEIFGYFTTARGVPEPSADFEARIIAGIDASETKTGARRDLKFFLQILSVAAGILILIGSYFFFINTNMPGNTFKDPKLAYAETMKILMDVSIKLNNGTRALEPIYMINEQTKKSFKAINHSTKIIEKNIRNLDYLNSGLDISNGTVKNDK